MLGSRSGRILLGGGVQPATLPLRSRVRPAGHLVLSCSAIGNPASGKCWFVGSGPGSVDYLTLKAVRVIERADAIVYDDLGTKDALQFARNGAQKIYVGKRGGQPSTPQAAIDDLLVTLCLQGLQVVRLKGGCPSVFSRVASELRSLARARVSVELVPGVSSALAAPLLAGFPLTDKELSGAFAVTSGHDVAGTDWAALSGVPTLVVLMAGGVLPQLVQQLLLAGWQSDTPVVVVSSAGTAEQRVRVSRLHSITGDVVGQKLSPCVVVVGRVAGLRELVSEQTSE